jgi:hypothetical protein
MCLNVYALQDASPFNLKEVLFWIYGVSAHAAEVPMVLGTYVTGGATDQMIAFSKYM